MLACYGKNGEIAVLHAPTLPEATAESLRAGYGGAPRVITVTSGNGGVGKSSVVINLAVSLAAQGKRVLVVDADLGTGDVCMLLGKHPPYNLYHVLGGERRPREIVLDGGCGIDILPAGMGVQEYAALPPHDRGRLMAAMTEVGSGYDFFLIDTGAGISANVTSFAVANQEILLVLTPELSSLTDAYALLKILSARYGALAFKIVVNKCRTEEDGEALFKKLTTITGRFLAVSLEYLGCLPIDDTFTESVRRRGPLCRLFPDAPTTLEFARFAQRITAGGGNVGAPMPLEPQAKEWRNELSS